MNEGRTKVLLSILGVLLLFVAWRFLAPALGMGGGGGDDDDYGDLGPVGPRISSSRQAKPVVEEVVDLRIADLQGNDRDYRPGRDPWRFVDPPPPPPPPPPAPPSQAEIRAQQEMAERLRLQQEEAARRAAEEAARPKPPPFTLKYIGKFGPEDRPIGVFTDGKNTYNVREGGVLQGEFIVAELGYESVEIQFVRFPNLPPQRLPVGR